MVEKRFSGLLNEIRKELTMRKFLFTVVLLIICSNFGFAEGQADNGDKQVVEHWSFWSPGTNRETLYLELEKEYEATHPDVDIQYSFVGMDILSKVRPLLVSNDPPDVIENNATTALVLADEGVLEPLNGYLNGKDTSGSAVWKDTFLNGALEAGMFGDNYMSIPMSIHVTGWFYDKTLFSKLGINSPSDWNGLISIMDKMRSGGVEPIAVDGNVDYYTTWPFLNIAVRIAGYDKYMKALSREISWNDPDFIKAAKLYKELVSYYQDGWAGQQYPAANATFVQGKAGLMWVGSWIPGEVKEIMPDSFDFDFFTFPQLPGQKESRSIVEMKTNGWMIPKDAENKDAAAEWLKFLTSKGVQERFVAEALNPSTKDVAWNPALAGVPEALEKAELIVPFYVGTLEPDFNEYTSSVVRPTIAQFAFGEIETAEDFVAAMDRKTSAYKGD